MAKPPEEQTITLEQALGIAVHHHTVGDLSKAGAIYEQILETNPNHADALHLLGVIAHQVGDNERAVGLIKKAIDLKPNFAEAHSNLGNAFKGLGKLDEAVTSYHKALSIKPDYAEAHSNLGNTLKGLGKLDEAVTSYHKALSIKPDYAEAHNNLGATFRELGRLNEAVTHCQKALAIKPDYVESLINLGAVLHNLGQLDEAIANYQQALAIEPNYAEAHNNLGIAFQDLGKHKDAFKSHQRAVAFSPQNDQFWGGLAASLETLSFSSVDDGLLQVLWDVLDKPTVAPSGLTRPIISALRHHPDFSQLLELAGSEKTEIGIPYQDIADRLSRIPLLLLILQLSPIYDLEIERVLTNLRHAMLRETRAGKIGRKGLAFSSALAVHCFVNEYIFRETKEEAAFVERLNEQIAALMISGQNIPPELLVGIAAYRPLYQFPWANNLLECDLPEDLKTLIARQLKEPLEEISLRDQIPSLSIIRNAVSLVVRDQYEENPYPRWIKGGFQAKAKTIGGVLRAPPLRLDLGEYVSPENPEILVAGCGTGQHAIVTVSRFSNAQVLAVDLSLSSLSYAMRKTKELGYSNIEYAQADIMELENLGRQFDLIECVGVLHHLENPLSGWRILVDLLRPGGLMRIGLYSEFSHQNIIAGRSLIAEEGYTTSPDDIRRCRQDIISKGKEGNRKLTKLFQLRDFFSLSECRDILFHLQVHRFTLPQIEEALQFLKLSFLGFEMRDQQAFRKFRKPHQSKQVLTSLSLWHKFELENPNTFREMYQFWCKKNESGIGDC